MKIKTALLCAALFVCVLGASSCNKPAADDEVAVLETTYGRIVIEFLPNIAPKHTANFKELARDGFYDGTRFHRIVVDKGKPMAIQGGDPNTIAGDPATWGQGKRDQKTLPAEFTTTMKHERGIVSAARKSGDVNSATSQFFICTAAQPGFDGQYSIFGRVLEGMNVVDTIARAPILGKTERPVDPVVVNRVYIIKRAELKKEQ